MKSNNKGTIAFKMCIIGDSGVGKTSLMNRFCDDIFEETNSTQIQDSKQGWLNLNGRDIKLHIWDTVGQEAFQSLNRAFFEGSTVIFIVYDVMNEDSFCNVDYWFKVADKLLPADATRVIVATKTDLGSPDQIVTKEQGQFKADLLKCDFYETSSKTSEGVQEVFVAAAEYSIRKVVRRETVLLAGKTKKEIEELNRTRMQAEEEQRRKEEEYMKNKSKCAELLSSHTESDLSRGYAILAKLRRNDRSEVLTEFSEELIDPPDHMLESWSRLMLTTDQEIVFFSHAQNLHNRKELSRDPNMLQSACKFLKYLEESDLHLFFRKYGETLPVSFNKKFHPGWPVYAAMMFNYGSNIGAAAAVMLLSFERKHQEGILIQFGGFVTRSLTKKLPAMFSKMDAVSVQSMIKCCERMYTARPIQPVTAETPNGGYYAIPVKFNESYIETSPDYAQPSIHPQELLEGTPPMAAELQVFSIAIVFLGDLYEQMEAETAANFKLICAGFITHPRREVRGNMLKFLRRPGPTADAILKFMQSSTSVLFENAAKIGLHPAEDTWDRLELSDMVCKALGSLVDVDAALLFTQESGKPSNKIFLENSNCYLFDEISVDIMAAVMERMLNVKTDFELSKWWNSQASAPNIQDVTTYLNDHLKFFLDNPLDTLCSSEIDLTEAQLPLWYDRVFCQSAVQSMFRTLDYLKHETNSDPQKLDACQELAERKLRASYKIYTGSKISEEGKDTTGAAKLKSYAGKMDQYVKSRWKIDADTSELTRPHQPYSDEDTTIAQIKLQAIKDGPSFRQVVSEIASTGKFSLKLPKSVIDDSTEVDATKGAYRMAQKSWMRGNAHTICDVNRALIVTDSCEQMLQAAQLILDHQNVEIVDFKDRVNTVADGGWSDLVLLFKVKDTKGKQTEGHINELQICLRVMMYARDGGISSYDAYTEARYYIEMLIKCGREFDGRSDEEKLEQLVKVQQKALESFKKKKKTDVKDAPKSVMCGWMLKRGSGRGIFGMKTLKRRWFLLKDGVLTYHAQNIVGPKSNYAEIVKTQLGGTYGPMAISECSVLRSPGEQFKFVIQGPHKNMEVQRSISTDGTPDMFDREDWINALVVNGAIDNGTGNVAM